MWKLRQGLHVAGTMRDLPRPHKNKQIGELSLWRHPAGSGERGWLAIRVGTAGLSVGQAVALPWEKVMAQASLGRGLSYPSASQHEVVVPGLTGSSTPAPHLLSGCLPLRMHQGISDGGKQCGG